MEKDELAEYLNALGRSDCYRTDALLKDSAIERTERVFFVGSNGSEFGPFIRKTIARESGQGRIYQKIHRAQQSGKRFAHLPRIFECYTTSDSLTVLIEYIQGSTLQEYVEAAGPSGSLAQRVFPLICDAVSELHEAFDPPIIHRDLTPANIIVSESSVTLIDFGIARTFSPEAERDTTYFGTRAYAPPEQFGFGQTDVRSDVYALGKVLRYCLIGGEGKEPQINERLAEIIAKATALDPAQRFQSIAKLKAAFLDACTQIARASEQFVYPPAPAGSPIITQASQQVNVPQPANVPQPSRVSTEGRQPSFQPQVSSTANSSIASQAQHGTTASTLHQPIPPQPSSVSAKKQPIRTKPTTSPVESASRRSARSFLHLFDRIPRPLGIAWDVFLALFWLLIFVAANACIIEPPANSVQYPTWFLIVEYYGLVILPCAITLYFLLDLRMLRDRYPNLKLPKRRKALPLAILIILALVVAVVAIANYFGFVAPIS